MESSHEKNWNAPKSLVHCLLTYKNNLLDNLEILSLALEILQWTILSLLKQTILRIRLYSEGLLSLKTTKKNLTALDKCYCETLFHYLTAEFLKWNIPYDDLVRLIFNTYTRVCPSVSRDNPQAIASRLFPHTRTSGQSWSNYFIPPRSA